MNINRDNYEEFFLLYVDNELTTAERKSVEQFIQENPDLAGELDLFHKTSLVPDDAIVYKEKELLMKNESDGLITMDNYEEWLVAYLDNELLPADILRFEKFAEQHPSVKEELAIFRNTKLQADTDIIFKNKQVLYRRDEKVRVITLQWWKVAVAAAIILTVGITTYSVLNRETQIPSVVATTGNKPATPKQNDSAKLDTDDKKEEQKLPAPRESHDAVASIKKADVKVEPGRIHITGNEKLQKKIKSSVTSGDDIIAKTSAPVKMNNAPDNKSIESKIIENTTADKKEIDPLKSTVAINNNVDKQNISNATVTNNTDKPYGNKETAYEPTTDTGAVFASNNEEGKNKKFRGFFRKATRVFEKRANISAADDDDKVLIGVLAVRLK